LKNEGDNEGDNEVLVGRAKHFIKKNNREQEITRLKDENRIEINLLNFKSKLRSKISY
jgi:hypothetical protein